MYTYKEILFVEVYIYKEILFIFKIRNFVGYYIIWNKVGIEKKVLYDFIYMYNLKMFIL